jgi:SAM-dependent methyltransferase
VCPVCGGREQQLILRLASQYIPWGPAVRLMLDVGAGGGSLGLLLHRLYGVQTLSTAFADWPYCEFIGERGGLCLYMDAMEPMPFAKFTFDVVHSGWVLHALTAEQLRGAMLEQHRILRPGGWLWIHGGWSEEQVAVMWGLLVGALGYVARYDSRVPHNDKSSTFDGTPFEVEWHVILQRPIATHCGAADRRQLET